MIRKAKQDEKKNMNKNAKDFPIVRKERTVPDYRYAISDLSKQILETDFEQQGRRSVHVHQWYW